MVETFHSTISILTTSYSTIVRANKKSIWSLWENVPQWPKWDVGLQHCTLDTTFTLGATGTLTPYGGHPIPFLISSLEYLREFTDVTKLPFGTMAAAHYMDENEHGLIVTHKMEAQIAESHVSLFMDQIWLKIVKGLPQSVENVARIASNMSFN